MLGIASYLTWFYDTLLFHKLIKHLLYETNALLSIIFIVVQLLIFQSTHLPFARRQQESNQLQKIQFVPNELI